MRTFSAYEKNQLALYNITLADADTRGEMPVEYMTGHVPFNGLDFLVTQDVLIPRIETEELVQEAALICQNMLKQPSSPDESVVKIADVGTGSGAIGISLSLALTKLNVPYDLTMSDVTPEVMAIAEQNWQCLATGSSTRLVSDLLAAYPAGKKYDLFVANLPYIPSPRITSLDASVVDFEPHLALDGGPEGLSLIEAFLKQAETRITARGQILLEIDYTHAEDVLRLNSHFKGYVKDDTFGQPRFAILSLRD